MKSKIFCIFAPLFALTVLTSCDDGRIYGNDDVVVDEGIVAKATGTFTGLDDWASGYSVALAGFNSTSEYAIISKLLPSDAEGIETSVVLGGITSDVETLEICVLNRLRQRVATLAEADVSSAVNDTVYLSAGTMDVSMIGAIQTGVFDQSCTACHGAGGHKAAGLDLSAGNAYNALVGVASNKVDGAYLVEPGNAEGSVLWQVLNTDVSATWHQNHSDMLNKERSARLLTLIEDWIDEGISE